MIRNESMETLQLRRRARARLRLRGHLLGQGARLHARRPREREAAAAAGEADWDARRLALLRRRRRHDAGALLAGRPARRLARRAGTVELGEPRAVGARASRCCSARAARPAATARPHFGDELAHVRDSLAAWHLRVPQVNASWDTLGQAFRRSVSDLAALRMRADGDDRHAPGRRHAVVHDGVRPRHADHVPADADLRARARAHGAARAREPAVARGRPVARRRAGEDRPRGAHGQGGGQLVLALLRHRRRDAALPRPARRGLALDGRRGARERAEGAGARGARAGSTSGATATATASSSSSAAPPRARGAVVEGLVGLAALPRRHARDGPDRGLRGAGLRLRREARHGRGGARRPGATARSPTGSSARRPSCERASTRRSGSRSAAASTRSRSTARSGASTRSRSNIGHLLFTGIVPAGARRRGRRPADGRRRSGRAGACGRCRPTTPASTRSATTTARSGPTTTP